MKTVLDSNETIINADVLEEGGELNLDTSNELASNTDETEVLEDNVIKIKPKVWNGKTIDRITLDYSKITGRVITQAERQFMHNGFMTTGVLFQSPYFQQIIASKISGIGLEFFLDKLTGHEVAEVCVSIQTFFNTGE